MGLMATALVMEAPLFHGVASGSLAVTPAAFVRPRPSARVVTIRETTALENVGKVPRLHVTTPIACAQDPCDAVAETKPMPFGSVFVSTTPVAPRPPGLRTVRGLGRAHV